MPRWLLWTAAAVVSWGVWAVLAKVIGDGLTGAQSQVLSTVGMVPVILVLARSKDLTVRPGGRRGMYYALAAGVVSGLGNVPYYDLFGRGGTAATAVSLTALYPVVTIALAAAFLGERVNRVQAVGLVLALVAIYLFNVSEEGGLLSGWLAYAFLPLVMWGSAGFLSKLATGHLSGGLAALLVLVGFLLANVALAGSRAVADGRAAADVGAGRRPRVLPGVRQLRGGAGVRRRQGVGHHPAGRPVPGGERADRRPAARRDGRPADGGRHRLRGGRRPGAVVRVPAGPTRDHAEVISGPHEPGEIRPATVAAA